MKNPNNTLETLYREGQYKLPLKKQKSYQKELSEFLKETKNSFDKYIIFQNITSQLFEYFDKLFQAISKKYLAQNLVYPALISKQTLTKADFFASFPKRAIKINNDFFLNPAVCYHVYEGLSGNSLNKSPLVFTSLNTCFRNEKLYIPFFRK